MRRAFLLLASLLLLLGLVAMATGCGADGGATASSELRLVAWTFTSSEGRVEAIELPKHVDAFVPSAPSSYTLTTSLAVPSSLADRPLALRIPFFQGLTELRVDGERATRLNDDLVVRYRRPGPQAWAIPPHSANGPPLVLSLRVDRTFRFADYFDSVPVLLPVEAPLASYVAVQVTNVVMSIAAVVSMTQIGFTYLIVFATDRRREAYLWCAGQALFATYYILYMLGYTQLGIGTFDIPGVALSLPIAVASSVYFTHTLFPLPPPSRAWPIALALVCIPTLCVSRTFAIVGGIGILAVSYVAAVVVYQIVTCIRLLRWKEPPRGAWLVLLCWVVTAITASGDLLAWLGLGELFGGLRGGAIGLTIFPFLQCVILSRDHIHSLSRGDALNAELAARVVDLEQGQREVQSLNTELRRQIADRSRQLFAAMALIGGRGDTSALEAGSVIQERYRVVRELGRGGMGAVYEVVRIADARRFALKVTHGLDAIGLARLAREAQIAAQIHHPNVVAIVDIDVAAAGFLYMVVEYVDGRSLDHLRSRFGDAKWSLEVIRQICEGLTALHADGIVHRDLKPANVLVEQPDDATPSTAPVVKIADFGISRAVTTASGEVPVRMVTAASEAPPAMPPQVATVRPPAQAPTVRAKAAAAAAAPSQTAAASREDEPTSLLPQAPSANARQRDRTTGGRAVTPSPLETTPLTQAGFIAGTPMYMAPELAYGPSELSPAADMFSLGVLAFELLAGRLPFATSLVSMQLENPVLPSFAEADVPLPKALVAALDACLAVDPAARPTAKELALLVAESVRSAA